MVKYSIAVCNYNMEETVEQAINSIIHQITSDYEIVIIDDASTDSSKEILNRMEEEHDTIRVVRLEEKEGRHLGRVRNISVEESRGEYVILDIDADDVYRDGVITDLTHIFHKIESEVDKDVVVQIPGVRIARKELWQEYGPYRNLPVGGEDMDLWRRLIGDSRLIYIDSKKPHRSIGYDKTNYRLARRWYRVAVADFQSGVAFMSYIRWTISRHSFQRILYNLCMLPVAYCVAATRPTFEIPEKFKIKGSLSSNIEREKSKIEKVEENLGISINKENLSEESIDIFYQR